MVVKYDSNSFGFCFTFEAGRIAFFRSSECIALEKDYLISTQL